MHTHRYGSPAHRLNVVTFRLEFLDHVSDHAVVTGLAQGISHTKRRPVWSESNIWNEQSADVRHEPADWIHHLALVSLQDRPNTPERLIFGLTGGLGVQDPLFE